MSTMAATVRPRRAKFLEHFANRAACLVGMEACGGAQHWARRLRALGHEVRLLPAKMVRPFVSGNKNDVHDARAIWMAVQQPGIKTVAVKSEAQQAVLALHRMRQQLVKFRTAQINGLRGLLAEYGDVMPRGRAGMRRDMAAALARVSERLPADCGDPRCRRAERDGRGCGDGRSGRLPVRARVCRLVGAGAPAHGHRRAGAHARDLQAWGYLPPHPVDPWRPVGAHQREGADGLATSAGQAASSQCHRRGDREQDSAHDEQRLLQRSRPKRSAWVMPGAFF